jgi:hypothetical protein
VPSFADNLKRLPSIGDIERIELLDVQGKTIGVIENKPGQEGSLAVYNQLQLQFDRLDAAAARLGLELYAEHTADARANPGKHPNIDRLLRIAEGAPAPAAVRLVLRTGR